MRATSTPDTSDFVPGDRVSFAYRGKATAGTVVRAAPKTVVVEAEDGRGFRVSRALLTRAADATEGSKLREVMALARTLMTRHRLAGWTFAFDHAKRRGAACHPRRRLISMATGYARMASREEIEDGILHEIAHALVGCQHQHDAVWRAKAREIGCSAQRCHTLDFSEPTVIARCVNGCFAIGKHRRRRNMRCRRCGGVVVYAAAVPPSPSGPTRSSSSDILNGSKPKRR